MREFFKENLKYIVIILLIVIMMTYYMTQKEGFHEDEMFSYGSSNYSYDNVYRPYGKQEETNVFVKKYVFQGNIIQIIKNLKYYWIDHADEKDKILEQIKSEQEVQWKTAEEAKEYLTIDSNDIFNYAMVYYNQSRDVHPPLFYFAVHTISIFFYGKFSKYIIFIINITCMIGSLWIIKNIFKTLDKEHLSIPAMILYGFSMGAISTVIFQRMYAMLTLFVLMFVLENIKIALNDFQIDKKMWLKLGITIILGFLTQYYFCIIAVLVAGLTFIGICKKREKKEILRYILNYLKIALLGVIIYPFCISHMFFSYRAVGVTAMCKTFGEKILEYFSLIGYSFSIPIIAIGVLILALLICLAVKRKLNKARYPICLLGIILIYIAIIVKISPELTEKEHLLRYVMCILPLIVIDILLFVDEAVENKKLLINISIITSILLSIYGIISNEPLFLYKGYSRYIEIANENKQDKFVYVGDTVFNHIQSMQEFLIYDESLILNESQLDVLKDNDELKNEDEFILSIKKYKGDKEILEKIIANTEFKNYELLLDDNGKVGCIIYRMKR